MSGKECKKCGEVKSLSNFYPHKQMRDGYLNECKNCRKEYQMLQYRKTIDARRAYEVKRFSDPQRKAKVLQYQQKARVRNKDKFRARGKVAKAIIKGDLQKLPCQVCGYLFTEAHHHDYSRPLDVDWLCFSCHRQEHGQQAK